MVPESPPPSEPLRTTWRRLAAIGVVAVALVVGATALLNGRSQSEAIANWTMAFHDLTGWKEEPPGPNMLFRYVHPTDNVYIRAAEHQVFADINPTPDETTDSMADDAVTNTYAKQHGWSAQRLPDVMAGGDRFSVVYREGTERKVLNAYLVKGNSTFIVSMASGKGGEEGFERERKTFLRYLQGLRLRPMTQDEYLRCKDRRSSPQLPRL